MELLPAPATPAGHFISARPGRCLLADYNILAGYIRVMVLIMNLVTPPLAYTSRDEGDCIPRQIEATQAQPDPGASEEIDLLSHAQPAAKIAADVVSSNEEWWPDPRLRRAVRG